MKEVGLRLYGYNTNAGQYEAVWSYTRSLGLLSMKGRSADDGRTIQYKGQWEEGPGQFRPLNATVRKIDGNSFVLELSGETPADPWVETMFTRRSSKLK